LFYLFNYLSTKNNKLNTTFKLNSNLKLTFSVSLDLFDLKNMLYFQKNIQYFFRSIENKLSNLFDFVDFRDYVLNLKKLELSDKIICIGVNFRLNFPYFEVYFKEKILDNKFKIYYFGSSLLYSTIPYLFVANKFNLFLSFLFGKINVELDSSFFFFNYSVFAFCNLMNLKFLIQYYLKSCNFIYLSNNLLFLNSYEVGLINTKLYNFSYDLNYCYYSDFKSVDTSFTNKKKDFVIYFGSWGFAGLNRFIFNLPLTSLSEYTYFCVNIFGYVKKMFKIFKPAGFSKRFIVYFSFFSNNLKLSLLEKYINLPVLSLTKKNFQISVLFKICAFTNKNLFYNFYLYLSILF
jgi:hypothetical protein